MELQGFNMCRHSEVKKDGTSRIRHVCVCAFVGVLSDMESRVGWLCRHFDSHVFVCVSSIELWEPSQRENVGDVPPTVPTRTLRRGPRHRRSVMAYLFGGWINGSLGPWWIIMVVGW